MKSFQSSKIFDHLRIFYSRIIFETKGRSTQIHLTNKLYLFEFFCLVGQIKPINMLIKFHKIMLWILFFDIYKLV
jgi:hypothetical protein